ncbi:ferredoxin [Candidatus Gottesmanbacteria bacterium]|nr:ferredoxin [Candidatus Gottesmanbacteria bacterium]
MNNYKIVVDRNLCIGAATCVAVAPKAFQLDTEAKAIVLPSFSEENEQTILDAAKSCPVAAIIVTDQTGKQLYP